MDIPEYVRYIGDEVVGIEYGNIVEVLTRNIEEPSFLYVKSPVQDKTYDGWGAENPTALSGKTFTFIGDWEYELIREEEKMNNKHKFKVGDIVCGNDSDRYAITNENMSKAIVRSVDDFGRLSVEILEHEDSGWVGQVAGNFSPLDPEYFDLVEDKPTSDTLYHITTDMKTFVDVEHNGNKGWSKCDTRYDEFDIHIGVNLALERLDEVENPPMPEPVKKLPKYVRYIGVNGNGGLNNGDICRVLSGVIKGATMYDDTLFVASPSPTGYNNANASNPSALAGVNFTYLWPDKYEIVDFNIHD